MKRSFTIVVLFAFAVPWVRPAWAIDEQARATARSQVNDGVALFQKGRFAEAERNFTAALEIAQVPTVALWAARAHERQGKWVLALAAYRRALAMPSNDLWVGDAQQRAQAEAREELQRLEARVPKVQVVLEGKATAGFVVTMDQVAIDSASLAAFFPADPGRHVLEVEQAGHVTRVVVELREAEERRVSLRLPDTSGTDSGTARPTDVAASSSERTVSSPKDVTAPRRTQSDDSMRTWGWVGVGVGTTGVLVGTVAGLWLIGNRASLHRDGCSGDVCVGDRFSDRVDRYNTLRTVSTIGFVVGGVGMATGVTLLLMNPRTKTGSIGVTLAADRILLGGEFR
ncbi:MAG: hypothetical protein QM784_30945 [Polyangiaceae bacterium]